MLHLNNYYTWVYCRTVATDWYYNAINTLLLAYCRILTQTAAVCNAIDYKTFHFDVCFVSHYRRFFSLIFIIFVQSDHRSRWWLKSFENESDKMCNTLRLVDSNVMYTNFCWITMQSNSFCRLDDLQVLYCLHHIKICIITTYISAEHVQNCYYLSCLHYLILNICWLIRFFEC